MHVHTPSLLLLSTLLLHALPGCDSPHEAAHAGGAAESAELEPLSTTRFGERVLLFVEHPRLVRGESVRFLTHLSVLATGEPVRAGRVTLSLGATTLVAEGPKRDGLFVPEGAIAEAGRVRATLVVSSSQVEETLDLGEFVVHASADEARRASASAEADEPAGAVPFLLEQQWKISLLLAEAGPRRLVRRLIVPGQLRAPEGAEAVVTPPAGGRLVAPDGGKLPQSGETVEAGQILGWIEPLLSASDVAELQALQLEFDLRALDVERAASEAGARLDFARREHERVGKLREHGLSTAREFDEAARNLALAESETEATRVTRESLERMRAARRERAGGSTDSPLRFPIVAPLRGTVIEVQRMAGEVVEASDELLRIRDTSRLWVEGRVSEFDLHLIGANASARVTLAALPGANLDIVAASGGLTVLPTIDSESRTAVLRGEVDNVAGTLRSGMLAELEIATAEVAGAVVVPLTAVVMDQGFATAYVMLEGELFQKRDLELGARDGDFVEIRSGLAAGERVATRGAYLVKLAALSPTSFGAGHQH